MRGKPTVEDLGIDVAAQQWRRSGEGDGTIEVAMVSGHPAAGPGEEWVLMRVAGDPTGRVLVYDKNEWECFLDGIRSGEFDDALGNRPGHVLDYDAPDKDVSGSDPPGNPPGDALGNDPPDIPPGDAVGNDPPGIPPGDAVGSDAAG